ncbi:MAG TPA: hypothetical protein VFP93_04100 [Gammaproteobacteria bacterium]|nr:hypothetical protein [Gammaproteobacteria bacterium]
MDTKKHYHILIATSCSNNTCHSQYTLSLANTIYHFANIKDVNLQVKLFNSEALLTKSRNICAAFVLSDTNITHLLFIDQNLQWEPAHVVRLLQHNKPIVAATYAKPKIYWERFDHDLFRKLNKLSDSTARQKSLQANLMNFQVKFADYKPPQQGLMEVVFAPVNFMLIQRDVFVKMSNQYPERKIAFDPSSEFKILNDYAYSLFDTEITDNNYWNSDASFCKRWIHLNEKIYLDLGIHLRYWGQYAFNGNILDLAPAKTFMPRDMKNE